MLLTNKTMIKFSPADANIVGHMCYAAYKLWNICNYERRNYKELGLQRYPDWYDQKSRLKGNLWFKSLPSQTAQEVCKLLDKSWKSFYALAKSGGAANPRPPRFKQGKMAITYMQNAIVHEAGTATVRLSLPKKLKEYMRSEYGICETYLYLENKVFQGTDSIRQVKIYPPDKQGASRVIVIYEIPDVERKPENGHYLSIDLGLHNLMTCYDSEGTSFIIGRKYLELCQYYDKEIARVQSQWGKCQASRGSVHPKPSKHLLRLYKKKRNSIQDYLHKVTRYVASYCEGHDITAVIIGDISNIRKGNNKGKITNQKLHALPYAKLYGMLEYKLRMRGIRLVRQSEEYTSQCSPHAPEVTVGYAEKGNRRERGLYGDSHGIYNADAVGAFNILRKYVAASCIKKRMPVTGLSAPEVIKVAV